MKILADEAIIIGMMDYREADRIVHLYSREYGRISGVARGAKKSVKRFGGSFELFALTSVSFTPNETLVAISSADTVTIFPGIRTSLEKIAAASYACELLAAITPERYPNKRVFRLLHAYLQQLDSSPLNRSDRHFFEINLLNILGYRPPLEVCAECGVSLLAEDGFWSSGRSHGIYCRRCGGGGIRLDASSMQLLLGAMKTGRFGEIKFNEPALAGIDRFMEGVIATHIGRALKSLAFLRLSP